MKINKLSKFLLLACSTFSAISSAKVTPEQAAQLGTTLTQVGAEKAANAAGTIPTYTGGISTAEQETALKNEIKNQKPLFVITAKNYTQYKDNLSTGQIALLEQYPDSYTIPVYKTHRTATSPEHIYQKAKTNAVNARLLESGAGLENFDEAIPFPIPQNGLEVIWNHITRYRGGSVTRHSAQMPVQRNGSYTPTKLSIKLAPPQYTSEGYDQKKDDNILFYYTSKITSPARLSGSILLLHETVNQVIEPRKSWTYNPGQRRVRRAPNVAYDAPNNGADGLRTADQVDMFAGAPDRYNWKLIGKKEMYIPYNSYQLASSDLSYDEIIQPGHINQNLTRYELHRVWQVEATIKDDIKNIYSKRVFYIDEDSWQIAFADLYDARGNLWRTSEHHAMQYIEGEALFSSGEVYYDLSAGRYLAIFMNEEDDAIDFNATLSRKDFSLNALRRSGKR
jgi:hypothetical protein